MFKSNHIINRRGDTMHIIPCTSFIQTRWGASKKTRMGTFFFHTVKYIYKKIKVLFKWGITPHSTLSLYLLGCASSTCRVCAQLLQTIQIVHNSIKLSRSCTIASNFPEDKYTPIHDAEIHVHLTIRFFGLKIKPSTP